VTEAILLQQAAEALRGGLALAPTVEGIVYALHDIISH
jgi:hypothetical protein